MKHTVTHKVKCLKLFVLAQLLLCPLLSADELFDPVRAFNPGAIKQGSMIEDRPWTQTVLGPRGVPIIEEQVDGTCRVSQPLKLAGRPCCYKLNDGSCEYANADENFTCPSGYQRDAYGDCEVNCDDLPSPSPSPSRSAPPAPSPSPEPSPSPPPAEKGILVIRAIDRNASNGINWDSYFTRTCELQSGKKKSESENSATCTFTNCKGTKTFYASGPPTNTRFQRWEGCKDWQPGSNKCDVDCPLLGSHKEATATWDIEERDPPRPPPQPPVNPRPPNGRPSQGANPAESLTNVVPSPIGDFRGH